MLQFVINAVGYTGTNTRVSSWKEVAIAYFKVLSKLLSGGTEENHTKLCYNSQSSHQHPNTGPPELKL